MEFFDEDEYARRGQDITVEEIEEAPGFERHRLVLTRTLEELFDWMQSSTQLQMMLIPVMAMIRKEVAKQEKGTKK